MKNYLKNIYNVSHECIRSLWQDLTDAMSMKSVFCRRSAGKHEMPAFFLRRKSPVTKMPSTLLLCRFIGPKVNVETINGKGTGTVKVGSSTFSYSVSPVQLSSDLAPCRPYICGVVFTRCGTQSKRPIRALELWRPFVLEQVPR